MLFKCICIQLMSVFDAVWFTLNWLTNLCLHITIFILIFAFVVFPICRFYHIADMETAVMSSSSVTKQDFPGCIIDFNFYYGRHEGEIAVKELAVNVPRTGQTQYFLFKQPYDWDELSRHTQKRNIMKRKAGLHFSWEYGNVAYHELYSIFSLLICNDNLRKSQFQIKI